MLRKLSFSFHLLEILIVLVFILGVGYLDHVFVQETQKLWSFHWLLDLLELIPGQFIQRDILVWTWRLHFFDLYFFINILKIFELQWLYITYIQIYFKIIDDCFLIWFIIYLCYFWLSYWCCWISFWLEYSHSSLLYTLYSSPSVYLSHWDPPHRRLMLRAVLPR